MWCASPHYACSAYHDPGRSVCDAGLARKDWLEGFVIDRLEANLLPDDNLMELVRLTNEELSQTEDERERKLAVTEDQLGGLRGRLHKLYDALETVRSGVRELAPRIRELRTRIEGLERSPAELTRTTQNSTLTSLDASAIKAFAADLQVLLSKGTILEQRAFLRSFVKRIELDAPRGIIYHTIPMRTKRM